MNNLNENQDDEESPLAKKNNDGYTPAHIAVRKLKLGLLEALIEAGAPIDITDEQGENPLMTAVNMDDIDAVNLLTQVRLFLKSVFHSFKTIFFFFD